jgi:hypothetical protein
MSESLNPVGKEIRPQEVLLYLAQVRLGKDASARAFRSEEAAYEAAAEREQLEALRKADAETGGIPASHLSSEAMLSRIVQPQIQVVEAGIII